MTIVPYHEKYKQAFIEMNRAWISAMFRLERIDIEVLNNIDRSIARGAQIFFAVDEQDQVMACCMITPLSDGEWEIEKFCARGMYTGTGAGSACLRACIDYAQAQGARKILIVSNRKCTHAVSLYRKNGFVEIPLDREKFPFERADIAFERTFTCCASCGPNPEP